VEIHKELKQNNNPYTKQRFSKALGFSRGSFYYQSKLDPKDKELALKILREHDENDDTLGHKKLGKLLGTGKNRVRRVMKKHGIEARRRKKSYKYAGKSNETFANLANSQSFAELEVIFTDMFEVTLADGTKIRGCFALRKSTRQILSLVFDYSMRAEIVVSTLDRIDFVDWQEVLWHSDQGSQYGAEITVDKLIEKGFIASMSRAGTPTDNGSAERFVGVFKLAVAKRRRYHTLGEFLSASEKWVNFYNHRRPHEALGQISPNEFAKQNGKKTVPYVTVF